MKALVSILIRTKNRAKCLKEALQSVVKQTHRPLEVIVINDDGENVELIVKKALQSTNVRWTYHQNTATHHGRSVAANKAMSLANADFLLFLDDDDLILENHIETLLNALQTTIQKDLIGAYSATRCVTTHNGAMVHADDCYAEAFDPIKLAYQNYLPIHSVLFKKTAYEKGCRFNEHLNIYEDWNFWLQVIQQGSLQYTSQMSALYRMNESGIGQPNTNLDFQHEWFLFIKHSQKYLNVKQLNHLMFSAKALQKCQTQLTKSQLKKDASIRAEVHLKQQLQQFQTHYETLETQLNTQQTKFQMCQNKQTLLNKTLNEQVQQLDQLKMQLNTQQTKFQMCQDKQTLLNKTLNEQVQQLDQLKTHNQILTDQISLLNQSRCRKLAPWVKKINLPSLESVMKIMYLSYIKEFFNLLLKGRFKQAFQKVQRKLKGVSLKHPSPQKNIDELVENGIDILATKHTLYIAELIKVSLNKVGKKNVRILNPNTTTFSDNLHFVICPQMFSKLPGLYIAFQMEQSVSSRWFTKEYFNTLENSYAIMDYSQENIRFLQEEGKLSYKQIFWTPISNISQFNLLLTANVQPSYDVVFYGDVNNPRRQKFIKQLQRQFSVLIIAEVFGEALYQKLQQGRVVVNIHYYENALLETTRIYECLSLNLTVISETSSDIQQHQNLMPHVTFTPINDIQAMCDAIQHKISQPMKSPNLPEDNENFHYFFTRMLNAVNLLDSQKFLPPRLFTAKELQQRIVLTLPETYQRHAYIKEKQPNSIFFSGLRHFDGWVGAAMSFKYLSQRALDEQVAYLEICEDDASFSDDFEQRYNTVKHVLFKELGVENWDIFCGLIADLSDNVTVQNVFEYQGIQFIELDKMTSMVFNIYNTKALNSLASWDATNRCINTNTIDRYLEREPLRVIVTLPFLVGHQPEHTSSIWHFKNSTYDELIKKSEEKLKNKVQEFKANCTAIELK